MPVGRVFFTIYVIEENHPDVPTVTRGKQSMTHPKQGLRVYIDPKRCIANAKCTTAAPGVYTLDEETGIAYVENFEDASVDQLFAGARVCPTQAIIIEQYGRRVFPQILTPMFGETPPSRDDES
jgi:ferredoxin